MFYLGGCERRHFIGLQPSETSESGGLRQIACRQSLERENSPLSTTADAIKRPPSHGGMGHVFRRRITTTVLVRLNA